MQKYRNKTPIEQCYYAPDWNVIRVPPGGVVEGDWFHKFVEGPHASLEIVSDGKPISTLDHIEAKIIVARLSKEKDLAAQVAGLSEEAPSKEESQEVKKRPGRPPNPPKE